ncbi:ComEC/Rec2 family competence protein [Clostridium grantii]|uniref:Competence protein ComEC n=1 Tax=Clostridium grantii DSM 8605 TaxID=1121316 RepID=A0A1M5UNB4_9CLOT|nr:ComEC/Rec2 family competence protein [Clostridium grantii]SHH64400.1 competence protein ComEC [Clostridium grantii DSM 8605]
MKLKPKTKKAIVFMVIGFLIIFIVIAFVKNNSQVYKSIDTKGKLLVHFIDVGQGDSILLMADNKTLLIDTGPNSKKNEFLDYLKSTGITKLDYIIATHPHEDHIGNMSYVIQKYDIGKFYAPKITSTTDSYNSMVKALNKKSKKITVSKGGMSFKLGSDVLCEILAPNNSSYDNLNNYSVVLKVTFKDTSFLLTGDAEKESEDEILSQKYILKADVLKLGHHGSSTSTTPDFLQSVDPKIAIASCGINNSYGHPNDEIINLLTENNIHLFRTDLDKTIILESDGKIIKRK